MTIASQPPVAVVTPVLNGEEFLAETMDSVQAQTYPNLVHIVLDNASTDATAQIVEHDGDEVRVGLRLNAVHGLGEALLAGHDRGDDSYRGVRCNRHATPCRALNMRATPPLGLA